MKTRRQVRPGPPCFLLYAGEPLAGACCAFTGCSCSGGVCAVICGAVVIFRVTAYHVIGKVRDAVRDVVHHVPHSIAGIF